MNTLKNNQTSVNYYGSLCTLMYEILHEKAPEDELAFYLSYVEPDMKILEPLCAGRQTGFCGRDSGLSL